MKNYRMTVQYDGSRYSGWQKQGNTENTIQGKIETVLEKMACAQIELHGSGRTDAGVHALGQVANFKCSTRQTPGQIQDYLNEYLPADIRITRLTEASPRFHARLNASQKHYRYFIDTNAVQNVFLRKYACHSPETYNLSLMKQAADFLTGEHDFMSFCDNKRMKKSTCREIYSIEITKKDGIITIDFRGNGFLYHMVRLLTGILMEVGTEKRKPEEIPKILQAKDRTAAGPLAPALGLFLVDVTY